ncbi:MAG: TonB C-terminal domain-containing protein, partial [Gemmatimonadota bacterium]
TSSVVASVALHAVAGLVALLYQGGERPEIVEQQTYRVQLRAPAAEEAPVRQKPQPAQQAEEQEEPPPPSPSDVPKPEVQQATTKEEQPTLPSTEPAQAPEEGEDAGNVQIEGKAFPFPDYLNNIVNQIRRHWRPPTGKEHLRAELSFVITRDGSVENIEWIQRSGNLAFDLEARGAIETAGRKRAFGPLPEAYPRDRLRVTFYFDPTTQ